MATETLYRPATVPKAKALADLFEKRPDVEVVSLKRVASVNGKMVANENGSHYEVTIKTAEFPPSDDSEPSSGGGGEEAPEPKEEAPSDEGEDGGEEPSLDGPPSPDEGGEGEGGKPKKLNPQEETVSLLRQILHALQGGAGGGLGGPDGPGGPADADLTLPDVGAPPAGGGLPHGKGGPPLPPPVPNPKHGPGLGGSFSHVAEPFRVAASSRQVFDFVRAEANTLGQKALIAEAASLIPTHKVTKLTRNTDGSATLEMTIR